MRNVSRLKACLLLCAVCLAAGQAWAHGSEAENWRVVANPPPSESLTVQIHNSPLGKQIVVANKGKDTLIVTAPEGRPFLRIGPEGVLADFAAAAWYSTQNPGKRATPPQAQNPDAPAQWKPVSDQPHWVWFDPRLSPSEEDQHISQKQWHIPARLGDKDIALTGRFMSMKPPATLWQPRINRDALPAGIQARIIPDPKPAIMLEYKGRGKLFVLDGNKQPLFQLSDLGVFVNTDSQDWKTLGRAPQQPETPWIKISTTARYSWPDPRLKNTSNTTQQEWIIPIVVNGRELSIRGIWVPIETER
ncbi:hypothetical protein [Litorivivens sp.]|uniref:hypothetical protein n=1 Tax=Litorivivens sp. TaxID=2020868 RepID=UPI003562F97B